MRSKDRLIGLLKWCMMCLHRFARLMLLRKVLDAITNRTRSVFAEKKWLQFTWSKRKHYKNLKTNKHTHEPLIWQKINKKHVKICNFSNTHRKFVDIFSKMRILCWWAKLTFSTTVEISEIPQRKCSARST